MTKTAGDRQHEQETGDETSKRNTNIMNSKQRNKHRRALVGALESQATAAAKIIAPDTPSNRTREASVWHGRAKERAEWAVTVSDETSVPLGPEPAATTLAQKWLERVVKDVPVDYRSREDVRTLLKTCLPVAERFIGAQLDALTQPHTHTDVLECVRSLGEALGESTDSWTVRVKRLRALSLVQLAMWTQLENAPTWAVVLALGNKEFPDAEYSASIKTLARDPVQWATPHIAKRAQAKNVSLKQVLDPTRIQALLESWPWPQAAPPLVAIAACADTGITALTEEQWGSAIMLAVNTRQLKQQRPQLPAAEFAGAIPEYVDMIRDRLNDWIEAKAFRAFQEWHLGSIGIYARMKKLGLPVSNSFSTPDRSVPFSDLMARMQELWDKQPLLAPKCGTDVHWACASYDKNWGPDLHWNNRATGLKGALNEKVPYKLVVRVPYTSPMQVLASAGYFGNAGWDRFPEWVAEHDGFEIYASDPFIDDLETDVLLRFPMSYIERKQEKKEWDTRRSAAQKIVKRVAASVL